MENTEKADIAVVGLAVMGSNLARNFASRGFKVAVYNRTSSVTEDFVKEFGEDSFVACKTYEDLSQNLKEPKRVVSMVKAGGPTDAVITSLQEVLSKGDIILDASNAWYKDTNRREEECLKKGINFLGVGVSGGEEGALKGPSIMPGGPKETLGSLKRSLRKNLSSRLMGHVLHTLVLEDPVILLKWFITELNMLICNFSLRVINC